MCKSLRFGLKCSMRTFVSIMIMRPVSVTMKIIKVVHCPKTLSHWISHQVRRFSAMFAMTSGSTGTCSELRGCFSNSEPKSPFSFYYTRSQRTMVLVSGHNSCTIRSNLLSRTWTRDWPDARQCLIQPQSMRIFCCFLRLTAGTPARRSFTQFYTRRTSSHLTCWNWPQSWEFWCRWFWSNDWARCSCWQWESWLNTASHQCLSRYWSSERDTEIPGVDTYLYRLPRLLWLAFRLWFPYHFWVN